MECDEYAGSPRFCDTIDPVVHVLSLVFGGVLLAKNTR